MGNQHIEQAENALLHTYNRYQIVLEKGCLTASVLDREERHGRKGIDL